MLRYALVPGASIADAVREGLHANLPLRRVRGAGPVEPLVGVDGDAVVVEAVKAADDGSGDVVVRVYESLGGRATGVLRTGFPLAAAHVCDLLEEPDDDAAALAPLDVDAAVGRVGLRVGPFGVVTVRLTPSGAVPAADRGRSRADDPVPGVSQS